MLPFLVSPSDVVVEEVGSLPCKTFAAAAPALPPTLEEGIAVVVELDVEPDASFPLPPLPWPVPPPEPDGSPSFLVVDDFRRQSFFLCSLLPQIQHRSALSGRDSQERCHLQLFPAVHPLSDTK